mmetsp:Transcript_44864/g.104585  ORF Transcript_44864/g.104585 Transcript_44864/m.104585 type:complete len:254 (-) Transcript_44864:671-1432(-)
MVQDDGGRAVRTRQKHVFRPPGCLLRHGEMAKVHQQPIIFAQGDLHPGSAQQQALEHLLMQLGFEPFWQCLKDRHLLLADVLRFVSFFAECRQAVLQQSCWEASLTEELPQLCFLRHRIHTHRAQGVDCISNTRNEGREHSKRQQDCQYSVQALESIGGRNIRCCRQELRQGPMKGRDILRRQVHLSHAHHVQPGAGGVPVILAQDQPTNRYIVVDNEDDNNALHHLHGHPEVHRCKSCQDGKQRLLNTTQTN